MQFSRVSAGADDAKSGCGNDEDDEFGTFDLLEALSDDDGAPGYDMLVANIRRRLCAVRSEQAVRRLTDQQVICRAAGMDGLDGVGASKEDQLHALKLLEARRLVDKICLGRARSRSEGRKKDKADRKLSRDYIREEIKKAYNAVMDQHVRYYNSVAIRVHKGEKAVDVNSIDAAAVAQERFVQGLDEVKEAKLTKQDREMKRRIA